MSRRRNSSRKLRRSWKQRRKSTPKRAYRHVYAAKRESVGGLFPSMSNYDFPGSVRAFPGPARASPGPARASPGSGLNDPPSRPGRGNREVNRFNKGSSRALPVALRTPTDQDDDIDDDAEDVYVDASDHDEDYKVPATATSGNWGLTGVAQATGRWAGNVVKGAVGLFAPEARREEFPSAAPSDNDYGSEGIEETDTDSENIQQLVVASREAAAEQGRQDTDRRFRFFRGKWYPRLYPVHGQSQEVNNESDNDSDTSGEQEQQEKIVEVAEMEARQQLRIAPAEQAQQQAEAAEAAEEQAEAGEEQARLAKLLERSKPVGKVNGVEIGRVEMPGVGDCQFEAIAAALSIPGGMKTVRNNIADAIEKDTSDVVANVNVAMNAYPNLKLSLKELGRKENKTMRALVVDLIREPGNISEDHERWGSIAKHTPNWGNELTLLYAMEIYKVNIGYLTKSDIDHYWYDNVTWLKRTHLENIVLIYIRGSHYDLATFTYRTRFNTVISNRLAARLEPLCPDIRQQRRCDARDDCKWGQGNCEYNPAKTRENNLRLNPQPPDRFRPT